MAKQHNQPYPEPEGRYNHTITFNPEGVTTGYDNDGKPFVSFTAKRIDLPVQEIEKLLLEAGVPKMVAVSHLEEMMESLYNQMMVTALLAHKA